jgi:hypothetical protein
LPKGCFQNSSGLKLVMFKYWKKSIKYFYPRFPNFSTETLMRWITNINYFHFGHILVNVLKRPQTKSSKSVYDTMFLISNPLPHFGKSPVYSLRRMQSSMDRRIYSFQYTTSTRNWDDSMYFIN